MILLHTAKISSKPLHLPATWQTARPLVPDQQLHFLQRRGKAPGRPERSGAKSCHATIRLSPMVAACLGANKKSSGLIERMVLRFDPLRIQGSQGSVLHTLEHSLTMNLLVDGPLERFSGLLDPSLRSHRFVARNCSTGNSPSTTGAMFFFITS